MGRIIADLKNSFDRGGILIQLIYINVALFLIGALLSILMQLFQYGLPDTNVMQLLFALPASLSRLLSMPWTLVTYMFVHAGLLHILFNMLWLYWFGTLFLYTFSARHLRGLYLFGGICGGLCYILSYNLFPLFSGEVEGSTLVGASASVLAIVTATAYREPDYRIQIFLLGSIRVKYLAMIVIALDVLSITSANAGGHIAHLGGALAGLWFAASLSKGTDLTAWLNWICDLLLRIFRRETWRRKPKMKIHYGEGGNVGDRQKDYDYNARKKEQSDEIDRILEKLKKSGYDSLTTEEKKRLFDASKR
jgi:membrane associated rhomboid family serine protease